MTINSDYIDILRYFVEETVQFLVVGGYAVMKHSEPYHTKDLDLWIAPHRANAERAYRSLARFGAPLADVTVDDLLNPDLVYQLGVEPVRIDLNPLPGGQAVAGRSDHRGVAGVRRWVCLGGGP